MWVELLCLFMKSVDFLKKLLLTLFSKKWHTLVKRNFCKIQNMQVIQDGLKNVNLFILHQQDSKMSGWNLFQDHYKRIELLEHLKVDITTT